MRIIYKILACLIGMVIGIVASAIAIELITGHRPNSLPALFGIMGGAIGWLAVGSKPSAGSRK